MDVHLKRLVEERIPALEQKVAGLEGKIDELVTLIKLGKMSLAIVKWTTGIGAALAAIWGALHFPSGKL